MDEFGPLASGANLTIILGAGASAPSGLPHWDQFAGKLATLSGLVPTEEAAGVLLRRQDPSILLEAARKSSGQRWDDHLEEALYGDLAATPHPSPLHWASAGHFLAAPDKTTLATLNFDTLLESALLNDSGVSVDIAFDDEIGANPHRVHHLHGLIFSGAVVETVVSFRDYADLIADQGAWQRKFLSNALSRGPVLFAGTSYRDPNIRHWLHVILRDEEPTHPALVTIVREGLGLEQDMFNTVSHALTAEWESIGLIALQLQDLADVSLMIRELKYVGQPDYRPPLERAKIVWAAHSRRFTRLQEEYSHALAEDARHLSKALGRGVKATRATLWIANGNGQLARWATEGSQYRKVSSLKFVPTGHDSPWIAGEAIGSEQVKLKDVDRDPRLVPKWKSVLAIPVLTGDGQSPEFATAVLTFGLSRGAATLLAREEEWSDFVEEVTARWGKRLAEIAFPSGHAGVD